ncbi:ABC transporter [Anaerobacillus alkalidiazotrophicus]|uniref:ABC transporter n=1 Tax=Anaerobacillus alkalidiazotrophicus TaxID=472963 RepID=A0A1S2M1X7_9BACI|nr:ATP-binding cassette domain-containing protein [Anaerobacillus alkalidiazotrophicus]OIJ18741.1 ABC transporter [Anaerobacillus alkalidiazotrophicus]
MSNLKSLKDMKLAQIDSEYPYGKDFFETMGLPFAKENCTLQQYISNIDTILMEDLGVERADLLEQFELFIEHMRLVKEGNDLQVKSITILGGQNKEGIPEKLILQMRAGEIISIVGPTGSGKSRLLADIEWMAQKDTPTKRQILINGKVPPMEWRFSIEHKLVAQLSQNMNFVMDLTVFEFIKMHAESRMVENVDEKVREIIAYANELAGETFRKDTPITALSGGQSRALMISDTAFLSGAPIVLIDEIENAGIDRKKALDLLVQKDKIVLMATHDPILALIGHRRIVIKNGGIYKIIETSQEEKNNLQRLETLDRMMLHYRELVRAGETLEEKPNSNL